VFCRQSCRQREYEARLRATELGLGEHELVITREELESLRDRLFLLACAVEDIEREQRDELTKDAQMLRELLDAARECLKGR
jgi:hypothetical protein